MSGIHQIFLSPKCSRCVYGRGGGGREERGESEGRGRLVREERGEEMKKRRRREEEKKLLYGRGIGGSEWRWGKRGEREGGGEGERRERKETREEREGKRGGESYYMNSPRLSRKVKGAKRMNMPREAVSHLSGKQRVIDQVYCRLLHKY